jgi:hypothetical protein
VKNQPMTAMVGGVCYIVLYIVSFSLCDFVCVENALHHHHTHCMYMYRCIDKLIDV